MFQLDWRDKKAWKRLAGGAIRPTATKDKDIAQSSVLVWKEHCVECSAPQCYTSCELYGNRGDGNCRRFSYGVYPNKAFSGLFKYGADVHFKRWAKLEAVWPEKPEIFPIQKIRWLAATLKLHELAYRTTAKLIPTDTLTFRRAQRYLRLAKSWALEKFAQCARSEETPDALYIKLFSPESASCNLQLELIQDVPVFRTNLEVASGWNEFTLPFGEFESVTGKDRFLRLWVDRDQEVRLIFTWLDLVKFKSATGAAPKVPADKVKCVAWDLDNTLWEGVIGDDGSEGVKVVSGAVDLIHKLDQRGIVQTIASKNEHDTAWAKVIELGLEEYFLYPAINWDPKSVNLSRIADELNINVNTFALIDDSEFERGEVSAALPQVRVYDEKVTPSLLNFEEFDVPVTKDTAKRRLSYIEEMKRKTVSKEWSGDLDGFLKDCSIELRVRTLTEQSQIERCLELLQRSNQFNLAGKRYAADEFDALLASPEFDCYAFDVKDRYGDYGIVGFVSVQNQGDKVMVTDFVMSCRVARKKVENAFFYWYLNREQCHGKEVFATMKATGRNQPLRLVFDELMFEVVEETPDGLLMRVDVEEIKRSKPPISVIRL